MSDPIQISRSLPGWLDETVQHTDPDRIILASRIRFARNLFDTPFRRTLDRSQQLSLVHRVLETCDQTLAWEDALSTQVHRLGAVKRGLLPERHLCSRDLADAKHPSGLYARPDGSAAVMCNEEDHVRLQVLRPGLDLAGALAEAHSLDETLGSRLGWARHLRLGFLTACHTNLGTGMRASVMLHVPALAESGELKAVLQGAERLHLAVRGRHGEGSQPLGHVYQISNLRSLGRTPEQIALDVDAAARLIQQAEVLARTAQLGGRGVLEDKIFRAWGILRGARLLTSEEANDLLGWLRVGRGRNLIPTPWQVLHRLWLFTQPFHLQANDRTASDANHRDRLRATLVRDSLESSS